MRRTFLHFVAVSAAFALATGCTGPSSLDDSTGAARSKADGFSGPITPQSMHVGATGKTCCMVTSGGQAALYLLGASDSGGELHLTTAQGTDLALAQGVPIGGYLFSPDGKWAMYLGPVAGGSPNKSLVFVEVATGMSRTLVADGLSAAYPLSAQSFFSTSGRYMIFGVLEPMVGNSSDLHAVDLATGTDVFHLGSGSFDYIERVTPDDRMVFQDTIGGTDAMHPPVQALFQVSLPAAATGAQPVQIDTHTASFDVTLDGETVFYTKTDGTLYKYDVSAGTKMVIASSVVSLAVGPQPQGPLAYVTTDRAMHLFGAQGAASAVAGQVDFFSPLLFSPDAQHFYYFQGVDTQDDHGALYAGSPSGQDGTAVDANAALHDLIFSGGRVLFLKNIDAVGMTGSPASANLDGSDVRDLGTGAVAGEVLSAPKEAPAVFATLLGGVQQTADKPIDGSKTILGGLGVTASLTSPETAVGQSVHTGAFVLSDDGQALIFAQGAAFDTTNRAYLGKLTFVAPGAPTQPIDGGLQGVSDIGAPSGRALFVNAPGATPAGVYFVRY